MRRLISIAALVVSSSVPVAFAAGGASPDAKLKTEIQTTLDAVAAGFNKADADAVTASFADDATLRNPGGMVGEGKDGVKRVIAHDIATILKGTTSSFTVDAVRPLGPTWAFVDATHHLANVRRPDGTMGSAEVHLVVLTTKKGNKWLASDARPYVFQQPPPAPPATH